MTDSRRINRRNFLKDAAGVSIGAGIFHVVPASALGLGGRVAPSNRITMGCVGVGGQGTGNMNEFLNHGDLQVVAVCDVDKNRANDAKNNVNHKYNNTDCTAYNDFREVVGRTDIDTISLATPDHWHGVVAVAALNSGKDVYGEKPLTHCLAEGRAIVNAQIKNARIWQTGSWQRSQRDFRYASELVRSGKIGKVVRVDVGLPTGGGIGPVVFTNPPPELDYNFWVGPSRMLPYAPQRLHYQWRWQLDYGGGQMMDWIGHHGDIAHWGMDCNTTGPIEIEGKGDYPATGIYDAATTYHFIAKYRNGVEMHVANAGNKDFSDLRMGTKWFGENGHWVWVDRGGLDAYPKTLLQEPIEPQYRLFNSPGHHREFLNCVKTREPTITPAEVAHRSASIGHLGQIAMITGRKIHWNPDTEQIADDPTASRMLTTPMRSPWHV